MLSASVIDSACYTNRAPRCPSTCQAAKFMLTADLPDADNYSAPCFRHASFDTRCPVFKHSSHIKRLEAVRCSVAGVSCFDFGSAGNSQQWLGESSTAALIYCRERMVAMEEVLVNECVVPFDEEFFYDTLNQYTSQLHGGARYQVHTLIIDPKLHGLPLSFTVELATSACPASSLSSKVSMSTAILRSSATLRMRCSLSFQAVRCGQ
jgi:hypothetical protein